MHGQQLVRGCGSEIPDSADDVLVFTSGPANRLSVNNLDSLAVDQIRIDAPFYQIMGNPIDLGSGLAAAYAADFSIVELNISLLADQPVDVADGGELILSVEPAS